MNLFALLKPLGLEKNEAVAKECKVEIRLEILEEAEEVRANEERGAISRLTRQLATINGELKTIKLRAKSEKKANDLELNRTLETRAAMISELVSFVTELDFQILKSIPLIIVCIAEGSK